VPTISESEQACGSRAERHHGQEKCRERVEAEMRADPREAERKGDGRRPIPEAEQGKERDQEQRQRSDQTSAVDEVASAPGIPDHDGERSRRDERSRAGKGQDHHQQSPVERASAPAIGASPDNDCPITASAARLVRPRS
jgi:hypothetical protein